MTFLPIVARELRVASRRRATYWVRAGAALAVIVLGTWVFLIGQQEEPPRTVARILFGFLTASATLYCLLSGVRSAADCLSEEKRQGTLGLLFLTDLKGYDVVLGKLAATTLNAFYGALAVVPMLAVPLLMGGVAVEEFGRMALVTLNALFFSVTTGIWVSALSRSARKARAMTFLLLLFFAGVLPACGAWLAYLGKVQRLEAAFLLPSVGYTYALAFAAPYKIDAAQFWWSLGIIHGLGWVWLVLASLVAPHTWQDRPAGVRKLRWRERVQLWSYGSLAERRDFRRRLLDANAYFWLTARSRLKPAWVWGVLGLVACGWGWGLAKFHREWLNLATYIFTAVVLNVLLKGWVALEAGRQLAEDRKQGALELLLSTPLTIRDILRGQMLALMRQFLGPLVLVLVVEFLFFWAAASDTNVENQAALWGMLWGGLALTLLADLAALFWVGMWLGLSARNPDRAASGSVVRILVVPGVAFALVVLVLALISYSGGSEPGPKFWLSLWFGLGLAVDLGFGAWARHKLLTEFRRAAEQRYAPRPGFWQRLMTGREETTLRMPPVMAARAQPRMQDGPSK